MASGSYAKKPAPQPPLDRQSKVPPRATRQLFDPATENLELDTEILTSHRTKAKAPPVTTTAINTKALQTPTSSKPLATYKQTKIVDEFGPDPAPKRKSWLNRWVIGTVIAVIFLLVLISAGIFQRSGSPQLVHYFGGQVYDIQVGGNLAGTWQTNKPVPPKVSIPTQAGPYSVLGKPTITAAFINKVLTAYHSPAAGKGQVLYDLGVKYGIDPAFALAFFMHESSFGTQGEARTTLALGNLRCIPNRPCVNTEGTPCQTGQSCYAQFYSWEDGFQAWYQLIRNLYIADWGRTTVDQIIPKYAPAADNNDETAYINALKQAVSDWRAGIVTP
jgi:hypothetical protein